MGRRASYDRKEVLAKALELFWARGYYTTSMKDLEVALDMRPGSIYAAFGSKEALFSETLTLYGDRSRDSFQALIAAAPTRLAGLAAYVRGMGCIARDTVPSRACMLVKTLLETPDNDPVLRRQTEDMMRRIEAGFAEVYRAAQAAGEISETADPERLASRLQAEVFGLRAYSQRTDSDARIAALAEDIARDIEALAQK